MPAFGDRLREAVDAAGLTDTQTAAESGIHSRTLERYFAREDAPNRPANVHALAKALGVRAAWLQSGEGEMNAAPEPAPAVSEPSHGWNLPLNPEAEPPGRYADLHQAASNVVWEMRDGDRVIYAVRVVTYVAATTAVDVSARVEPPAPVPEARRAA